MSILASLVARLNSKLNPVAVTVTNSVPTKSSPKEPAMTNAVETEVKAVATEVVAEVKKVVEEVVAKVEGKQVVNPTITLQDLQSVVLSAHLSDIAKNAAATTEVPQWSSSNTAVVSVTPTDATGQSATVTAGAVGNAGVTVKYKNLAFTYNFAVVNGEAVALTVSAGDIVAYTAPVAAVPPAPVTPVEPVVAATPATNAAS